MAMNTLKHDLSEGVREFNLQLFIFFEKFESCTPTSIAESLRSGMVIEDGV